MSWAHAVAVRRRVLAPGSRLARQCHWRKSIVMTVEVWRCVICGCSYDAAQAKRRRRGEPPISQARTVVCSAECRRRAQARLASNNCLAAAKLAALPQDAQARREAAAQAVEILRSEERRVGKECRSRWS